MERYYEITESLIDDISGKNFLALCGQYGPQFSVRANKDPEWTVPSSAAEFEWPTHKNLMGPIGCQHNRPDA